MRRTISYASYTRSRRMAAAGVAVLALATYWLTLEPSASYWDCGEYIASAVGLQPGHPPGNPVYWLAGRVAASVWPERAALCVNALSGLMSAGAVVLLFLTIARMAGRLLRIRPDADVAPYPAALSIGAGAAGALLFAWTDTFWFSAVEAEVYAFAALLTALAFWLMLVWYDKAGEPHSDRYLVAVAYVMGLSLGVHQLVLLCLPALAVIYAYRRRPRLRLAGALLAALAGMAAIAAVLWGILPGSLRMAGFFELRAVNDFGCPYDTGVWIWLGLFSASFIAAAAATGVRRPRPAVVTAALFLTLFFSGLTSSAHTVVLTSLLALLLVWRAWRGVNIRRATLVVWCTGAIVLGLSAYGVVIIRSRASTPVNEGDPSDVLSLASYIRRDQYGSHPFLYGPTPHSPILTDSATGRRIRTPKATLYTRADSAARPHYTVSGHVWDYRYASATMAPLTRIFSSAPHHLESYADWVGASPEAMRAVDAAVYADSTGREYGRRSVRVPTAAQQAAFFASYQTGYMYLRYLMWNFAGRQNDRPSQGQADAGNFITGIPAADRAMLGRHDLLPTEEDASNPGRNVYYLLPLALGILGAVWQWRRGRRGRRQFNVTLALFLMTGLAIVVYLNQTPNEPRERDYAFAGSFYAYAIWVGLGACMLSGIALRAFRRAGRRGIRATLAAASAGPAAGLAVAALVLWQNADDHDRSGRTAMPDYAANTLLSTGSQAILFTDGDNYTFPLWYAQEVEGVRTDVRVVNMTYLNTVWYTLQLLSPSRLSAPLAMTQPRADIASGRFRAVRLAPLSDTDTLPALEALRILYADTAGFPAMPARYLRLGPVTVDSRTALAEGKGYITGRTLAMLDIVATNLASPRPRSVHWSPRSRGADLLGLDSLSVRYGATLRLDTTASALRADTTATRALLPQFRWGGAPVGSRTYIDPTAGNMMEQMRLMLLRYAGALTASGRYADAAAAVDLMTREMPFESWPAAVHLAEGKLLDEAVESARIYIEAGRAMHDRGLMRRGMHLLARRLAYTGAWLRYYSQLDTRRRYAQTQRGIRARKAWTLAAALWLESGASPRTLAGLSGAKGIFYPGSPTEKALRDVIQNKAPATPNI